MNKKLSDFCTGQAAITAKPVICIRRNVVCVLHTILITSRIYYFANTEIASRSRISYFDWEAVYPATDKIGSCIFETRENANSRMTTLCRTMHRTIGDLTLIIKKYRKQNTWSWNFILVLPSCWSDTDFGELIGTLWQDRLWHMNQYFRVAYKLLRNLFR